MIKNKLTTFLYGLVGIAALLIASQLACSWITLKKETKSGAATTSLLATEDHGEAQEISTGVENRQSVSSNSAQQPAPRQALTTAPVAFIASMNSSAPSVSQTVGQQSAAQAAHAVLSPSWSTAESASGDGTAPSGPTKTGMTLTGAHVAQTQHSAAVVTSATTIPVTIPAVFGDPAAAGVTSPDQSQQIAQIAKDFSNDVTQSGASPSSPAYQQAWDSARYRADQTFKQQYGNAAFEAMQLSTPSQ